ncbi:MAG: M1 family metallopeptidase [Ignavibacteriales bacterium]|nr:M1 family metallopeptidase [Ignavibacteriales bacterium]
MTTRSFFLLLLAAFASTTRLTAQERPLQPGMDVLHYEFSLLLPEEGRHIEGLARLTVRRTLPVDHLMLDLVGLRVDTVWVNQKPVGFERRPGLLDIPLIPSRDSSPDTLLIAVRYGGEVKDGLIIHTDEKGRWYAFGDNWPTRARCWLPTVDQPGDKATVTWTIVAPSNRTVVANGTLVEQKTLPLKSGVASQTSTTWTTTRPIPPYLMVIAAGPLVAYDLGLTARGLSEFPPGVRQSVFVVPELADYPPGPFKKAGEIVEYYSRTVAPFPFEKLAHVQSFTRYGGMENASAIFYANDLFESRSTNTGIIAHETAHQWFGDAVTPRSWGHLWLSEGFASYFEQLWVQKSEGTDAFRKGMIRLRNEIIDSKVTYNHPVIDTLQANLMQLLNSNSYQKGAWVLHMMRSMLGDSLFFAGIRTYYDHHRHGTATTDDLCESFEQVSRSKLRWFFDQWLRRPGLPELRTAWSYDEALHRVTVDISQRQSASAYRFPLALEVHSHEGKVHIVSIDVPALESARIQLPLILESKPLKLVFDPQVALLASIKSN